MPMLEDVRVTPLTCTEFGDRAFHLETVTETGDPDSSFLQLLRIQPDGGSEPRLLVVGVVYPDNLFGSWYDQSQDEKLRAILGLAEMLPAAKWEQLMQKDPSSEAAQQFPSEWMHEWQGTPQLGLMGKAESLGDLIRACCGTYI